MKTTEEEDPIPPMKPNQWNSYRPEDIKRWGVERFMDEIASHGRPVERGTG